MPLRGVICGGDGQLHSFDHCITCHIEGTGPARKCHTPLPLLVAMSKNAEERKDAGISATMLLDCPRKVALAEEYDYFEAPDAYWARFRGTIGHLLMEAYPPDMPGLVQERRVRRLIEIDRVPFEVTGKPDWIDTRRRVLIDFKTSESLPKKLKDGHEAQLNIYRWLIADGTFLDTGEPCRLEIERAGIQYMSMKGTVKMGATLWSLAETERFVRDRLTPLVAWKKRGELPPPEPKANAKTKWKCRFCPLSEVCDELLVKKTAYAA